MFDSKVEEILELPLRKGTERKIYSASKSIESVFEAPLNAYVITREDMYNAGVTSIAEAMRLVPGVIVRETVNGNYDIHWRGLDNVVSF